MHLASTAVENLRPGDYFLHLGPEGFDFLLTGPLVAVVVSRAQNTVDVSSAQAGPRIFTRGIVVWCIREAEKDIPQEWIRAWLREQPRPNWQDVLES